MKHALCLMLVAGSLGCDGNEGTARNADRLKEGINIFEKEGGRLSGAYLENGHVVYFQVERQDMTEPRWWDGTPESLWNINAAFADENGEAFISQYAGEAPEEVTVDETYRRDPALRLLDHRMARKAAQALISTELGSEVNIERQTAVRLGLSITEEELLPTREAPSEVSGETAYSPYYTHRYEMDSWSIWWTAAQCHHTSVFARSHYQGGTCGDYNGIYQTKTSCNHGNCASANNSAKHCGNRFCWRTNAALKFQNSNNGACTTPYNNNPATQSNDHVCNDDTMVQLWNVAYNTTYSTTAGTCGDDALRCERPACP